MGTAMCRSPRRDEQNSRGQDQQKKKDPHREARDSRTRRGIRIGGGIVSAVRVSSPVSGLTRAPGPGGSGTRESTSAESFVAGSITSSHITQYDQANYNHKSGAMSTRPPPPKIHGRPFPYSRNPGKTGRLRQRPARKIDRKSPPVRGTRKTRTGRLNKEFQGRTRA